jgi:hypothetical protein
LRRVGLRGLRGCRLLWLLAGFRRLLRRGRIRLLREQQRRRTKAGNQQGTQDSRNSVLHCHKNLGELGFLKTYLDGHYLDFMG